MNESIKYTLLNDEKNTSCNPIYVRWDMVQEDFQCCGIDDYNDWNPKKVFPESCCNVSVSILINYV